MLVCTNKPLKTHTQKKVWHQREGGGGNVSMQKLFENETCILQDDSRWNLKIQQIKVGKIQCENTMLMCTNDWQKKVFFVRKIKIQAILKISNVCRFTKLNKHG